MSKKNIFDKNPMVHELFLAKYSFEQFSKYILGLPNIPNQTVDNVIVSILQQSEENNLPLVDTFTNEHRIISYSYYSAFLFHLYNYYDYVFSKMPHNRELFNNEKQLYAGFQLSNSEKKAKTLDSLLTKEVLKIMTSRVMVIKSEHALPHENDESVYLQHIPQDFGEHFRTARNHYAHIKDERVESVYPFSLSNFYQNYHLFVYLLYESCLWLGMPNEFNDVDLGEISDFANNVTQGKSKLEQMGYICGVIRKA